ncbi:MAG: hypothetical protein M3N49_03460 [Candidatus Eremiobacteraeota bacterium]|nr:hypothetical protein [Candidatus Eremiobacteraeota bacterium]
MAAEAVLAVIALAGVIASSPLLVSKARLIRERDAATKEADALRGVVGAFQISMNVLDHLRAKALEVRAVQIVSTRYVGDLVTYIRAAASAMPEIPTEIARRRAADRAGRTKGATSIVRTADGRDRKEEHVGFGTEDRHQAPPRGSDATVRPDSRGSH